MMKINKVEACLYAKEEDFRLFTGIRMKNFHRFSSPN